MTAEEARRAEIRARGGAAVATRGERRRGGGPRPRGGEPCTATARSGREPTPSPARSTSARRRDARAARRRARVQLSSRAEPSATRAAWPRRRARSGVHRGTSRVGRRRRGALSAAARAAAAAAVHAASREWSERLPRGQGGVCRWRCFGAVVTLGARARARGERFTDDQTFCAADGASDSHRREGARTASCSTRRRSSAKASSRHRSRRVRVDPAAASSAACLAFMIGAAHGRACRCRRDARARLETSRSFHANDSTRVVQKDAREPTASRYEYSAISDDRSSTARTAPGAPRTGNCSVCARTPLGPSPGETWCAESTPSLPPARRARWVVTRKGRHPGDGTARAPRAAQTAAPRPRGGAAQAHPTSRALTAASMPHRAARRPGAPSRLCARRIGLAWVASATTTSRRF